MMIDLRELSEDELEFFASMASYVGKCWPQDMIQAERHRDMNTALFIFENIERCSALMAELRTEFGNRGIPFDVR